MFSRKKKPLPTERQAAYWLERPYPPRPMPEVQSWVGGLPAFPSGVSWPLGRGDLPLHFLGQIDLSELPGKPTARSVSSPLPASGMLYFFADITDGMGWYGGPKLRSDISAPGYKSDYDDLCPWARVVYSATNGLDAPVMPENLPELGHSAGQLDGGAHHGHGQPRMFHRWPVVAKWIETWPYLLDSEAHRKRASSVEEVADCVPREKPSQRPSERDPATHQRLGLKALPANAAGIPFPYGASVLMDFADLILPREGYWTGIEKDDPASIGRFCGEMKEWKARAASSLSRSEIADFNAWLAAWLERDAPCSLSVQGDVLREVEDCMVRAIARIAGGHAYDYELPEEVFDIFWSLASACMNEDGITIASKDQMLGHGAFDELYDQNLNVLNIDDFILLGQFGSSSAIGSTSYDCIQFWISPKNLRARRFDRAFATAYAYF